MYLTENNEILQTLSSLKKFQLAQAMVAQNLSTENATKDQLVQRCIENGLNAVHFSKKLGRIQIVYHPAFDH